MLYASTEIHADSFTLWLRRTHDISGVEKHRGHAVTEREQRGESARESRQERAGVGVNSRSHILRPAEGVDSYPTMVPYPVLHPDYIAGVDINRRQLRWVGHVRRMDYDRRLPRRMLSAWVRHPRPQGAPKMTYGRSKAASTRRSRCSTSTPRPGSTSPLTAQFGARLCG